MSTLFGHSSDSGRKLYASTVGTISSRTARAGDSFGATLRWDVPDAAGGAAIPAGSVVSGTVVNVRSSPRPGNPGTLTLAVSSVNVGGSNYPIDASIDSLATERQGHAAADTIVGRIIGKNPSGTVIGVAAGRAAGARYGGATGHSDVRVPPGAHLIVTLRQRLLIAGS